MLPLTATLSIDPDRGSGRRSKRRTLRLEVDASSSGSGARAYVINLSETGLLLETQAGLETDDTIVVELPHAGSATARVVWTNQAFAGCEFIAPISTATVSAALLLAPFATDPSPPVVDWLGLERRAREADLRPTPEFQLQKAGFALMASLVLAAITALGLLFVLLTVPL